MYTQAKMIDGQGLQLGRSFVGKSEAELSPRCLLPKWNWQLSCCLPAPLSTPQVFPAFSTGSSFDDWLELPSPSGKAASGTWSLWETCFKTYLNSSAAQFCLVMCYSLYEPLVAHSHSYTLHFQHPFPFSPLSFSLKSRALKRKPGF